MHNYWGNKYGIVWALMLNPVEPAINDESRMCPGIYADALITSKGVRLYQRTPRVATSNTEKGN